VRLESSVAPSILTLSETGMTVPYFHDCWLHGMSTRLWDVYHTSTHDVALVMAALRSTCEHYIFVLWFLSIFFYSSPNLSCRGLDVYHASMWPEWEFRMHV